MYLISTNSEMVDLLEAKNMFLDFLVPKNGRFGRFGRPAEPVLKDRRQRQKTKSVLVSISKISGK